MTIPPVSDSQWAQPPPGNGGLSPTQQAALRAALAQFEDMLESGKFNGATVVKLQEVINSLENAQPPLPQSIINQLQNAWHDINMVVKYSNNPAQWENFGIQADQILIGIAYPGKQR